jgi:3-hydroxyisobutyrate dehydrogenase-like beta-hydroxyacid dehydrogenase
MTEAIAFVGLGNMGLPMATRLLEAGHALTVYNRTPEKAKALVAAGAKAAADPADAVTPGGVVFTIVANDAALEEVTLAERGLLGRLGAGGVHISLSTVGVETAARMEKIHAEAGAAYLCAPVFGRPPAAAAGKLAIALSGAAAAKERIRPLLEPLSQRVDDFGEAPAAANVVKLAGNFLIGSAIEALAEACALAEKGGVDRTAFIALMSGTLFDCPVYKIYGSGIARSVYQPAGMRLVLGLKDMGLVLDAANGLGVPMPMGSLLRDRLIRAVNSGQGEDDWMAADVAAREDAGLAS